MNIVIENSVEIFMNQDIQDSDKQQSSNAVMKF